MTRGWPLAVLAAVALIVVEAGAGAVTRIDPYGTTLLDGRKVFPIVLAKGPERGAETPTGGDAVAEVVSAGVNFLKVGPATVPWTDADVDDALAWNREATEHGAYTWINLATLSESEPGDTRLREVVTALKEDAWADAIGLWKGADEPLWVGTTPEELQLRVLPCDLARRGGLVRRRGAGRLRAPLGHDPGAARDGRAARRLQRR